jgi:hypothetical protein
MDVSEEKDATKRAIGQAAIIAVKAAIAAGYSDTKRASLNEVVVQMRQEMPLQLTISARASWIEFGILDIEVTLTNIDSTISASAAISASNEELGLAGQIKVVENIAPKATVKETVRIHVPPATEIGYRDKVQVLVMSSYQHYEPLEAGVSTRPNKQTTIVPPVQLKQKT